MKQILAALRVDFSEQLAIGTKLPVVDCESEAVRKNGMRHWMLMVVRQANREWATAPDNWPRRAPERRTETIGNRVRHPLAVVSLQAAALFQKTKGNVTMPSLFTLGALSRSDGAASTAVVHDT